MPDDALDIYAKINAPSPEQAEALIQDLDRQRRLRAKPPPQPWWTRAAVPVAALAAAAAVLLVVLPGDGDGDGDGDGIRNRSIGGGAWVSPEQAAPPALRLAIERDGIVEPLKPGKAVQLGDRLFFRIESQQVGTADLWIDGPSGREKLSSVSFSQPGTLDVPRGDGLLAWRFDARGRYHFEVLADGAERCVPSSCAQRTVDVR